MPIRPSSPIFATSSYGNDLVRSSSSATGATSLRAKSRTVSRIRRCSSVSEKSIGAPSITLRNARPARDRSAHARADRPSIYASSSAAEAPERRGQAGPARFATHPPSRWFRAASRSTASEPEPHGHAAATSSSTRAARMGMPSPVTLAAACSEDGRADPPRDLAAGDARADADRRPRPLREAAEGGATRAWIDVLT